jgi:hypothetical protein
MKPVDGEPVRRCGTLRKWVWVIPLGCWLFSMYLPAGTIEFPTHGNQDGRLTTRPEQVWGWTLLMGGPCSISWAPDDPFVHWERANHSFLILLCWSANLLFVVALLALQSHRKLSCWLSAVANGLMLLAPTTLVSPPNGGLKLSDLHAGYYVWSFGMFLLWVACVVFPRAGSPRSGLSTT